MLFALSVHLSSHQPCTLMYDKPQTDIGLTQFFWASSYRTSARKQGNRTKRYKVLIKFRLGLDPLYKNEAEGLWCYNSSNEIHYMNRPVKTVR